MTNWCIRTHDERGECMWYRHSDSGLLCWTYEEPEKAPFVTEMAADNFIETIRNLSPITEMWNNAWASPNRLSQSEERLMKDKIRAQLSAKRGGS